MRQLIILILFVIINSSTFAVWDDGLLTNGDFETDSTPGNAFDAPDGWIYYINYNSFQTNYIPYEGGFHMYIINATELAQAIPHVVQDGDIITFEAKVLGFGGTVSIGSLQIRDWANNVIAVSPDFSTAPNFYLGGWFGQFTASVDVGALTPAQKATVIGGYASAVIRGEAQLATAVYVDAAKAYLGPPPDPDPVEPNEPNVLFGDLQAIVREAVPSSDSYGVSLTAEPASDVDIYASPGQNGSDIDLGAGPGNQIVLNFNASNYPTPQLVTVTAVNDLLVEGTEIAVITHTVVSSDPCYSSLGPYDVNIKVIDDDFAGDIDHNLKVDFNDLRLLAGQWMNECLVGQWCNGADLSGTTGQTSEPGRVDFVDYGIFAQNYANDYSYSSGLPAFPRSLIYWQAGPVLTNLPTVTNNNYNTLNCWASPLEYGFGSYPRDAYSSSLLNSWSGQLDILHQAGVVVYTTMASGYFEPPVFESYGLDPDDYYALDESGNRRLMLGGAFGDHVYSACYNNPNWFDFLYQICDMYADIGFDGMFYDLGGYADPTIKFCHCDYCKADWQAHMVSLGRSPSTPLPTRSNGTNLTVEINRIHLKWRWDLWGENWGQMFNLLRAEYPQIAFSHNLGIGANITGGELTYLYSQTDLFDYVHMEEWGHGCAPWSMIPTYLIGRAASNDKPVTVLQFDSVNEDPRGDVQHKVALSESIACESAHQHGNFFPNSDNEAYNNFADTYEQYLTNTDSYANVGVVISWWSKVLYEDTTGQYPNHWMGQMLLDMHVPFDFLIAERDLTDAGALLAKYKTIILPDLAVLTDSQIAVLYDYLDNGGSILATYKTGIYDENRASTDALDEITGLSVPSWTDSLVSPFQSTVGSGRFAYIRYCPEKNHWVANPRDLKYSSTLSPPSPPPVAVLNAFAWAFNNTLPLTTDADISTEILLNAQNDRILMHLVNYNVYPSGNALTNDTNINSTVTIPAGKTVSDVFFVSPDYAGPQTITGWSQNSNQLQFNLPTLKYYSLVVIELQ